MKNVKFNFIQIILIIYLFFSIFISSVINITIYNLYINPIFWIILTIYLIYYTSGNHGRFSKIVENMKSMLIITLFYLILNFFSGLIFGFVNNPYSNRIIPFITNFWQIIIPIIGIEYTRSVIINENIKNKLFIVIFTIVFILFEINFSNLFGSLNNRETMFKYVSSVILPLIFGNILYTYLTIKGSYKLVLVYRILTELTFILVPILPNLDWFTLGIRGIIVPALIYIFLRSSINHRGERSSKRGRKKQNPIIYFPIFTIVIIFVLFMAGVFIYEPVAIISNSMTPVFYRGDVVVYRKVDNNKLKKLKLYTIIIYSKDGQAIVHRVVRKYYENGELYFITRGDANNSDDYKPVSTSQIIGIYQTSVKYIGYPSVWLNQFFNYEKPNVEIK